MLKWSKLYCYIPKLFKDVWIFPRLWPGFSVFVSVHKYLEFNRQLFPHIALTAVLMLHNGIFIWLYWKHHDRDHHHYYHQVSHTH